LTAAARRASSAALVSGQDETSSAVSVTVTAVLASARYARLLGGFRLSGKTFLLHGVDGRRQTRLLGGFRFSGKAGLLRSLGDRRQTSLFPVRASAARRTSSAALATAAIAAAALTAAALEPQTLVASGQTRLPRQPSLRLNTATS